MKDLQDLILLSLLVIPCSEEELKKRDFLKNISEYGIDLCLNFLEKNNAIYYKGKDEIMHPSKKWIKKNRKYLLDE